MSLPVRVAILAAVSSIAFSSSLAHAQTRPAAQDQTGEGDVVAPTAEIVVTGTRGALQSAEQFKRDSDVLVDGISADDIGALPDESIADSLVRIPGLTANDDENGFAEVSVRGLGPDLADTTYNGRVLPSTRFDSRRLNLGDLPTEGIARAYVQKTASASTIEGGLGGTIGLESVHPLDTRRRGLSVVVRGTTDDVAQSLSGVNGYKPWGYRGEVTYIGRLAHNFGVAVSYAHIQQTNAAPSTQLVNPSTTAYPLDADGDGYPDIVPGNAGINMGAGNQKRDSVLATAQWQPTSSLTATLDGYLINSTGDTTPLNFVSMNNGTVTTPPSDVQAVDSVVRVYQGYTGLYRETVNRGHQKSLQLEGGLNLKWDNGGPFSVAFDLSWAQAKVTGHSVSAQAKTLPNNPKRTAAGQVRPFGFNSSDPYNITLDFGPQSASDYMLTEIDENNPDLTDTAEAARLDFRYNQPLAIFASMDFGLRVDRRIKDNNPDGNAYTFGGLTKSPALDDSYLVDKTNPLGDAAKYLGGPAAATIPLFDIDKLLALETYPTAVFNSQPVNDARGDSHIAENTMAAYYQANISAADGRLTGNIGVRYLTTDDTVDGFAVTATSDPAPLRVKSQYDYWLPALNLRYALTHTLYVRGALSKTMSRPVFSDMRIGSAIDFTTVVAGDTIVRGNPNLKPFTSKNADLDLEWYPSKSMTFGVQGFYKEVNNFIVSALVDGTLGLPDGSSIPVTYKTSVNDPAKRKFYGFEVIARRDFDFLPGFLGNLGANIDYSHNWTDAVQLYQTVDGNKIALTPNNFTPWTLNAQLYYTTRRLNIRVAYRRYAPYMRENSNGYQSRPDGTLDATASFALRRGIRIIGTIQNLTKSRIYSTQVDARFPDAFGIPRNVIYPGRSITVGVRAHF